MAVLDEAFVARCVPDAEAVRAALAAEWVRRSPSTSPEIAAFYRDCPGELMADDLEAFHADPERQRWTEALVHVVQERKAKIVIDVGCGAGHDLLALWDVVGKDVLLYGVEPNDALRMELQRCAIARVFSDVAEAPIGDADLLSCFDVLEHVPDPEAFLTDIAMRAPVGALFMETTATTDLGTPLHLEANQGWHPGRALRRAGWECIDESGRLRLWQRFKTTPMTRTPVVVCANREIGVRTYDSILRLTALRSEEFDWMPGRASESGLLRARSVWASKWYRERADDGFLMVDADIEFQPEDAEKVVRLGRETRGIAVAAYPVRDGSHLALHGLTEEIAFGPGAPPVEIRLGSTGFMFVHRDVLDAMIPTLQICHANEPWALWPMFDFKVVPDALSGGYIWLSEDWWFCERARELGFGVWLDPSVELTHWGHVPVTTKNMAAVSALNRGLPITVQEG